MISIVTNDTLFIVNDNCFRSYEQKGQPMKKLDEQQKLLVALNIEWAFLMPSLFDDPYDAIDALTDESITCTEMQDFRKHKREYEEKYGKIYIDNNYTMTWGHFPYGLYDEPIV